MHEARSSTVDMQRALYNKYLNAFQMSSPHREKDRLEAHLSPGLTEWRVIMGVMLADVFTRIEGLQERGEKESE